MLHVLSFSKASIDGQPKFPQRVHVKEFNAVNKLLSYEELVFLKL